MSAQGMAVQRLTSEARDLDIPFMEMLMVNWGLRLAGERTEATGAIWVPFETLSLRGG